MNLTDFELAAATLSATVSARLATDGGQLSERIFNASVSLIEWLDYLHSSERTGCYDEAIDGLRASIVEVAGCAACGFIRPAIFSLRAQVDILLSWLYFKDHPVEWSKVVATSDGFMLKRQSIDYLTDYVEGFDARMKLLASSRSRNQVDPYRVLSAHVHAQGYSVLPTHTDLASIVGDIGFSQELASLQHEVSEYLEDVLLATFGRKWASLPDSILTKARVRLGAAKTAIVFS